MTEADSLESEPSVLLITNLGSQSINLNLDLVSLATSNTHSPPNIAL